MRHVLASVVVAVALAGGALTVSAGVGTQTKDSQAAMAPDAAVKRLLEGNARFVAGATLRRDLVQQLRETRDGVPFGHLAQTLALLQPAVEQARDVPGPHTSKNDAYVQRVAEENVRLTARALTERSQIPADLVRGGQPIVVPALYDVETGVVSILD